MTKQSVFTFAALIAFVAAPAFAQCKDAANKDKGACCASKGQQVKECSDKDKAACAKDGKQDCSKTCSTDAKQACSKDGKSAGCAEVNCAGDQVRYKGQAIPRMVYQVGDQRLTCPKSSVALAKEKGVEIQYVVAGEVMDDKAKAMDALSQQVEKAYENMLTVNYCVDGKTTGCCETATAMAKEANKPMCYGVGSFCFDSKEDAEKAAKVAREAGDKVQMVMLVGDEKFDCPHHASEAAKQNGAEVKYCVGEMNTTSEAMANIQLTVERIKTALDEIEKLGGKQIASNS